MQSPIPIEPMHSFSHGYHDHWHMVRGGIVCMTTRMWHNMVPILVNLCLLLTPLQFDIRDPFHGQLTAVKTWHPLTTHDGMTMSWAQV